MKSQTTVPAAQMPMPGMPIPGVLDTGTRPGQVQPGSKVMYHGHVKGGPRFGTRGVVREVLGRRVVVDLDKHGTWHVPSYFLSVALKAA